MGKILNAEEGKHIVSGYSFKSLDFSNETKDVSIKTELKEEINQEEVKEVLNSNNSNQIELIEKLLKKSDELTSSIIRLEQQLQSQAKDCNDKLAHIKETSYQAGYNEGYNKAKQELEAKINDHLSKLVESLHKIEEVYKEYQSKAENIEKELVGVAVDIAEEVIEKELSKHSKEIALNLTKELLNDIKEATQIEIKVNPLDYDYIKDNLNLDKIKVIPDNAISVGGVVILSDAGNIEAEIHKRFEAIKNHILKG